MSNSTTKPRAAFSGVLLIAFGIAAFFTLLNWSQATPPFGLVELASNDDFIRMVTVRNWLAGQHWFDPVLPTLGVGEGTVMHWSRLIDAPIGALIVLGNSLGFNGERFASIVWPFLNFVATAAGFLVTVRRASGSSNLLPTLIIGGFALGGSHVLASGVIDHHNTQLALMIWLIAMLIPGSQSTRGLAIQELASRDLAIAGLLSALMLAIGMEGLPMALAGAVVVFVRLLVERDAFIPAARAYGLSLAASHFVLFFLLIGPDYWSTAYCDSFSIFHLVCGGIGGLAIWSGLHPHVRVHFPHPQIVVPLLAGVMALGVAAMVFPRCLTNPMDQLDPKMHEFWLDKVIETQNFFQVLKTDPWLLPYIYALPILALIFGGLEILRNWPVSKLTGLLIFTAVTTAVTLFQLRGTHFSAVVAAAMLAVLVTRFADGEGKQRPVMLLGTLALSCLLVWKIIMMGAISIFAGGKAGPLIGGSGVTNTMGCDGAEAMASLAAQPAGLVAASNSLGAIILLRTPQSVIAGPYHRDIEGNIAWINTLLSSAPEAEKILKNAGVTLLAFCPADGEEQMFAAAASQGLASRLMKGDIPLWLEPVSATMNKPLRLFKVLN